ncbi:MAG: endonuclease III domain-containing protein [Planctomycetota bacterium]|nr:endonuclease III domain-containing protein [Planctomycetota bacterium]
MRRRAPRRSRRVTRSDLDTIYRKLSSHFGPMNWWPGDTPFEMIVGAILTQNTAWRNVVLAIRNLKEARALSPRALRGLSEAKVARLIRPSGYFRVKARRLRSFIDFLYERHQGSLARMFRRPLPQLREELLGVSGIGPETADSILLYAGGMPSFVVDAYTRRVFGRHYFLGEDASYEETKSLFEENLPVDVPLFNEYHALIVNLGKDFCRPRPRCEGCPLEGLPHRTPPRS